MTTSEIILSLLALVFLAGWVFTVSQLEIAQVMENYYFSRWEDAEQEKRLLRLSLRIHTQSPVALPPYEDDNEA